MEVGDLQLPHVDSAFPAGQVSLQSAVEEQNDAQCLKCAEPVWLILLLPVLALQQLPPGYDPASCQ